jgi:hypothetical protein
LEVGFGIGITWVGDGSTSGGVVGVEAHAVRKIMNRAMKNLKRAEFRICMD